MLKYITFVFFNTIFFSFLIGNIFLLCSYCTKWLDDVGILNTVWYALSPRAIITMIFIHWYYIMWRMIRRNIFFRDFNFLRILILRILGRYSVLTRTYIRHSDREIQHRRHHLWDVRCGRTEKREEEMDPLLWRCAQCLWPHHTSCSAVPNQNHM